MMYIVKSILIFFKNQDSIHLTSLTFFYSCFVFYLFLIVPLCNYTLASTFSPSPTRSLSSTAHGSISTPSVNIPNTTTMVGISSVFVLNILYTMLVLI